MRPFALITLLTACAVDDEGAAPLADEALAPPAPFHLDVTQIHPGQPYELKAYVGQRNKLVYFGASFVGTGQGPCPNLLRGTCLDIRQAGLLGTARSDANGVATFTFYPDYAWAGQDMWIQAAMPRGNQPARTSDVAQRTVLEIADVSLPVPVGGERGWHEAFGYGGPGDPSELWWNNSELCMTGQLMGNGDLQDLAWHHLDTSWASYGCFPVADGGGDAFYALNDDGSAMVTWVNQDYTAAYEDTVNSVNNLGLRVFADADTIDRQPLPDSQGYNGLVVGQGAVAAQPADVWWNYVELCMVGARIGVFSMPSDIDLASYAATPVSYDCYRVSEFGGDAFVLETAAGDRAAVWVELGYTTAYEGGVNEIALRVVR